MACVPSQQSHFRGRCVASDHGASLAAHCANEPGFEVGYPQIIGPLVGFGGRDLDKVVALVVAAVDEQAAVAGLAHFSEGNFSR